MPVLFDAGGRLLTDSLQKTEMPLTREDVRWFSDGEQRMKRLGLSFYCVRCYGLGLPDGVEGNNDEFGHEAVVACTCMIRRYRRASP